MTGPGTNTYLLGDAEVLVLDPGPAISAHVDSIVAAVPGTIRWILVTHTHPDHSPGVAELAARTGALVIGAAAPEGPHQDRTFRPDRVAKHGDVLRTAEFSLEFIHTPGHASNHYCYLQTGVNILYTGDHIMDGSTVVIDPPDGNMNHYLQSLAALKTESIASIAPGHGDLLSEPYAVIDWIVDHRLERERKIVAALRAEPLSTSRELVRVVYAEVDQSLHALAERSLLAHLIKLEEDSRATVSEGRWRLR